MQEPSRVEGGTKKSENGEPDSNATSKETLKDLEESGKVPDSKSERSVSETPSPDGALDETRDKTDDAGPI
jgi:hypothetical protein